MNWKVITGILMLSLMSALYGCGSGDGGKVIFPLYSAKGSTTAVVSFSTISSSALPNLIGAITITTILPPGVSVPTDPSNPRLISSSALVTGSALALIPDDGLSKIIQGDYSSAGRQVRITVAAALSGFGTGEYARLTCTVDPGATLTTAGFNALNSPPPGFEAYDVLANDISSGYLTPQFAVQ